MSSALKVCFKLVSSAFIPTTILSLSFNNKSFNFVPKHLISWVGVTRATGKREKIGAHTLHKQVQKCSDLSMVPLISPQQSFEVPSSFRTTVKMLKFWFQPDGESCLLIAGYRFVLCFRSFYFMTSNRGLFRQSTRRRLK